MEDSENIAQVIRNALIGTGAGGNEVRITDGLYAVADALNRIAKAIEEQGAHPRPSDD